MAEKYRPSNGTEGDAFMTEFWIVDASGPKCTAFIPSGAQLPIPRCTKTPDMFGEPQ